MIYARIGLLWIVSLLSAMVVASAAAGEAEAQGGVTVYQFAIDHPVDDAPLNSFPQLGESVPQNVVLSNGDEAYAYFYFAGQPVIVDINTRSIVKIGR